jgi:hypothetical protein
MRRGKSISLSPADRRRLKAHIRDRNAAQMRVRRAEIVLCTARGAGASERTVLVLEWGLERMSR